MQWNTKTGRWGVNLDMAQPGDRDVSWRDARIGLNYGVAPGVRTGVGVSLGDDANPGRPQTDQRRPGAPGAPGNHLQVLA
ncbi:MAG: NtrZ family periplasmic regulatory protein [Caulobacteraceae bacterium]